MPDYHFPLRAAFLAVPLQQEEKIRFQALQNRLQPFDDILRFQNPETPHLTLQYWKELMEIEYHQIIAHTKRIAATSEAFTLKIQGIETFGHRGKTRVLFLNVPFSEELARLKKRCPWPSLDPFNPHITLARIRHPERFAIHEKKIMKILGEPQFTMHVDRLRLYAEIEGKKQTLLQDFLVSSGSHGEYGLAAAV